MTTPAEQAARCRRLAREFAHDRIAQELLALAEELEAKALRERALHDAGTPYGDRHRINARGIAAASKD